MSKGRLEAITDGVVAIILTILVLDLKIPDDTSFAGLYAERSVFFAYIVSFIFIVIIWNAHHLLFVGVKKIDSTIIWTNFFWIFWLSLAPFVTSWVGRGFGAFWPAMSYAIVFAMWTFSFSFLSWAVSRCNEEVRAKRKGDQRNFLSIVINLIILSTVFFFPPIALFGRFLVAFMWVAPARYFQKK